MIDAHQHFWQLSRGDYDWISADLSPLNQDYLPVNLAPILADENVGGTILVQAAASMAETFFMLDLAEKHTFIKGVVGWIDFDSANVLANIEALAAHKKLVGIRPLIQDIEQKNWVNQEKYRPIFDHLVARNLTFDGLVRAHQLDDLTQLASDWPDLKIVLDHGGKPNIAQNMLADWAEKIDELAKCAKVYCKLSGLWTEAGGAVDIATIGPFARHLLRAFGSERLMWGSDWPVLLLAGQYGDWLSQAKAILTGQDEAAHENIFHKNALRFYGISE